MPRLRSCREAVAGQPRAADLSELSSSDASGGGHAVRQDADAADGVVRPGLAGDHREERPERGDARAHAGGSLSRGVDDAPTLAGGDGARRAGAACRRGRGRRDLRRRGATRQPSAVVAPRKCVVVIAVEVKLLNGLGRVRMRHVANASGDELVPSVCDTVARGAIVLTDGWGGYNDLPDHGHTRHKTVVSFSGDPAYVSTLKLPDHPSDGWRTPHTPP